MPELLERIAAIYPSVSPASIALMRYNEEDMCKAAWTVIYSLRCTHSLFENAAVSVDWYADPSVSGKAHGPDKVATWLLEHGIDEHSLVGLR